MPSHGTPLIEKFARSSPKIRASVTKIVNDLAVATPGVSVLGDFHGYIVCPQCGSPALGFCRSVDGKVSACCKKPGCVAFLG